MAVPPVMSARCAQPGRPVFRSRHRFLYSLHGFLSGFQIETTLKPPRDALNWLGYTYQEVESFSHLVHTCFNIVLRSTNKIQAHLLNSSEQPGEAVLVCNRRKSISSWTKRMTFNTLIKIFVV